MNYDMQNVEQARKSFDRILSNKKYADIIKDDKHLSLLLGLLDKNKYDKILDIGTGTGYLAFPLAERFPSAKVCGIDIAETVIDNNQAVVEERNIQNLDFIAFDGLDYPFEDENFDLIVTRYAFHHFPDPSASIKQMNKILKEGGKVIVSDPMKNEKDENKVIDSLMKVKQDGHIQFYSSDELEELFISNGFSKEKQVISEMKFPFAPNQEYIRVYEGISDKDKALYDLKIEDGVVWVGHIDVGNTVFVKD